MPDKYILMRKSQLNIKGQGTNFRVFGRLNHIATRIRYQYGLRILEGSIARAC